MKSSHLAKPDRLELDKSPFPQLNKKKIYKCGVGIIFQSDLILAITHTNFLLL